jgi:hypothetical protein
VAIRDSPDRPRTYVSWTGPAWPTFHGIGGVFAMSGLTDWERHRLAGLERQLTHEDPRLAARLSGNQDAPPAWARRRTGWLMIVVGLVLTLSGSALRDDSVTLVGLVVLICCWVPFWRAGRTVSVPRS